MMFKLFNIRTKRKARAVKFTGDNQKEVETFLGLKFEKTEEGALFRLGQRININNWVVREYDDSKTLKCEYDIHETTTQVKKIYIKSRLRGGKCSKKN